MAGLSSNKYDPIFHFESWVSNLDNPSDFKEILPLLKKFNNHIFLRQQILYHKGDFSSLIEKFTHFPSITVKQINLKHWLFSVEYHPKDLNEHFNGLLAFIPSQSKNIFKAISVSKSAFWNIVVRKLIRKSYPEIMRVFLKQVEIKVAFETFQKIIGDEYRIHILDATLKSRRESKSMSGLYQFDTDRIWRDQSIEDLFDEALEKTQWLSSLVFSLQKRNSKRENYFTVAKGKINKFGEISSDFYFEQLEDGLINILEDFASKRLELYQNRGIRERDFKPSPPLAIGFDTDVFSNIEEIRKFGKTMLKYPDSSIAVYHGNPYYHANIADFSDGSSFDLWILSPTRILIAPQAKSSPQALERITSYIFYEFREGSIEEYVE